VGSAEDDYVVVELSGRLGNQLFQFAAGLGIARRRSAQLLFRSWRVAPDDLLLPLLVPGSYVEASPPQLRAVGQFPYDVPPRRLWQSATVRATRWSRRARGRTGPTLYAWGDTGVFKPGVFDLDLPAYVQGHLQSERYFEHVTDEVVDAISWPRGGAVLPQTTGRTVALSFRRGDYNALGWALPLEYYDAALEIVRAHDDDLTLVLFGDDAAFLELAAARYDHLGPMINALDLAPDPVSQLRMMSECDHCVIANSSFAWWGAWLGDHASPCATASANAGGARLVVAPSSYGAGNDRLPARWRTVPTPDATRV